MSMFILLKIHILYERFHLRNTLYTRMCIFAFLYYFTMRTHFLTHRSPGQSPHIYAHSRFWEKATMKMLFIICTGLQAQFTNLEWIWSCSKSYHSRNINWLHKVVSLKAFTIHTSIYGTNLDQRMRFRTIRRIDALLTYFMRRLLKIAIKKWSTESIKTTSPFDIHRDSIQRFELKHKETNLRI